MPHISSFNSSAVCKEEEGPDWFCEEVKIGVETEIETTEGWTLVDTGVVEA